MPDAIKNFAYTTVTAAPSPATSGTSLTVADASVLPSAPFNMTVWPATAFPLASNAEIIRVTGISGNVLTIERAQESSTARTIVVGDQIAATFTAKLLNDVWDAINSIVSGGGTGDVVGPASATDGRIAVFDGSTGKLLKVGTKTIAEILSDAASDATTKANAAAAASQPVDADLTAIAALSTTSFGRAVLALVDEAAALSHFGALGATEQAADVDPAGTAIAGALGGKADASHSHSNATSVAAGFMPAADKAKSDTLMAAEATVASATTTDIGAATSEHVSITGTTTITGFGTVAAGTRRTGRFTGALTLTHNATSLILPGGANITTAAGDRFSARSLGSGNWVVDWYQRANGQAIDVNPAGAAIAAALAAKAATPAWSSLSGTTPSIAFADQPSKFKHTITGNTTYSFSSYAEGRVVEIFLEPDSAERTLAFTGIPDGAWLEGKPASIKAGKKMQLRFECTTASDTGVFATYGTAP